MFKSTKTKKRSLRATVVASVLISAVPASAAVLVQNFMKASFTQSAACVTKVAGLDAVNTIVTKDVTATATTANNVAVLNEQIAMTAYVGDRTIASDTVRIKNTCATPMKVYLQAEPGINTTTTSGSWTGLNAMVYLSKVPVASGGAAPASAIFSTAAQWDQAPLNITPSATGVVANATTGVVTIPAGSEIQIGVLADSAAGGAGTGTAVLNYTVNAYQ